MTTAMSPLTTDDRLDLLTEQLAMVAEELRAQRAQRDRLSELAEEVLPLTAPLLDTVTAALQEADQKGYFAIARGGGRIIDEVITSFDEDDVKALGDNVVLILNTVKELTQPEVMALLRRTAITAQQVDEEVVEPPSVLALLRQLRDPQTRRGLGRVMTMLHTVGAEQRGTHPSQPEAR